MKRLLVLLFALTTRVEAQSLGDASSPSFGGLGSVAAGITNRYTYLGGTPDGSFQNSQFGLRASVPYGDKLAVSALINWREDGQGRGAPRTDITYLFATYRLSRAWDLRVGKVKYPSNLYSEIFDIGTLRPFLTLPQGIYGGTANAFSSYTGVGVNGTAYVGAWRLGIASYVSGGNVRYRSKRVDLYPGTNGDLDVNLRRSAGGRLVVRPPVQGLSIGISGTSALISVCGTDATLGPCLREVHAQQGSAQFEYLTDRLWLRSEFALLNAPGFLKTRGGYAQAAWFLSRKWQVAAQYDAIDDKFDAGSTAQSFSGIALPPGVMLPPGGLESLLPKALDRHRDLAFGLNYWLAPEVVAKVSVHDVDGWRFAGPSRDALLQGLFTGQLPSPRSRLLQAGIQFNF